MALDVGTLVAYLVADTTKFKEGIEGGEGRLKKFGKVAAGIAGAIGSSFLAISAVGFVKDAVKGASDLNETASKIQQIFGANAESVMRFAATADKGLGLSKQAALDSAATFATFGKGAGLAGNDLEKFSESSVKLAGDLASFFNTDPSDAAEAIGAAFRGEMEPIRAYGVLLDEASLKAEAVRTGIVRAKVDVISLGKAQFAAVDAQRAYNKAVNEHGRSSLEAAKAGNNLRAAQAKLQAQVAGTIPDLTQQQKVLATQRAIIEQTSDAQGDFGRTSSGLANQQRILNAEFANLKASLGASLLGPAKQFVTILATSAEYIARNRSWLVPLVASLGGLALAIYLIVQAIKAWTVVQWALNIAMDANPIGLVIIAIALLAGGIYLLWTRSAGFRNFFIGMWNHIWSFMKVIGAWFAGPFADFFVRAWHNTERSFTATKDFIVKWFTFIVGLPGFVAKKFESGVASLWGAMVGSFKGAVNAIIGLWNMIDFGIHLSIPDWVPPPFGGKRFDIDDVFPDVAYLARGGVVKPTPGGTPVVMGEAGQVEIGSPEPLLRRIVREESGSGGAGRLDVYLHGDGVLRGIRATTRIQGGSAQTTLVGAPNA